MNRVSITSRSNPLLVRLRRLAGDSQAYRKQGQIWLEGEHLCKAYATHGGIVEQGVITDEAWEVPRWRNLAQVAQTVAIVPASLMAGLSTLESSPPLAFAVAWPGEGDLRPDAPSVVLDRVQDAGNVGSVLRSAAALGFTQVIALEGTAGLWSPKVLRAAMGAHFSLCLVEAAAARLAELQVPLLATGPRAMKAVHEQVLPWPCAWVFGHEGQGVAPHVLAMCRELMRIPQPGGEESMNVAAAAAVCLYESMRQQAAPGALPQR